MTAEQNIIEKVLSHEWNRLFSYSHTPSHYILHRIIKNVFAEEAGWQNGGSVLVTNDVNLQIRHWWIVFWNNSVSQIKDIFFHSLGSVEWNGLNRRTVSPRSRPPQNRVFNKIVSAEVSGFIHSLWWKIQIERMSNDPPFPFINSLILRIKMTELWVIEVWLWSRSSFWIAK